MIEVDDQTAEHRPILVEHNIMINSTIDHKQGNLVTSKPPHKEPGVNRLLRRNEGEW